MAILEECCIASADMQWLFYSGERIVGHGPLIFVFWGVLYESYDDTNNNVMFCHMVFINLVQ